MHGYAKSLADGELKIALRLPPAQADDEPLQSYVSNLREASLQPTQLAQALRRYTENPDARCAAALVVGLAEALDLSQGAVRLLRAEAVDEPRQGPLDEDVYRAIALNSIDHDRVMGQKLAAASKATANAFAATMEHLNGLTQAYGLKSDTTLRAALRASVRECA